MFNASEHLFYITDIIIGNRAPTYMTLSIILFPDLLQSNQMASNTCWLYLTIFKRRLQQYISDAEWAEFSYPLSSRLSSASMYCTVQKTAWWSSCIIITVLCDCKIFYFYYTILNDSQRITRILSCTSVDIVCNYSAMLASVVFDLKLK